MTVVTKKPKIFLWVLIVGKAWSSLVQLKMCKCDAFAATEKVTMGQLGGVQTTAQR